MIRPRERKFTLLAQNERGNEINKTIGEKERVKTRTYISIKINLAKARHVEKEIKCC